VVAGVGAGRVGYYRQPQNVGAIPNFNECILRSRGDLVHILHDDDYVLPGFYAAIGDLADRYPQAALFATRSFYVDSSGRITGATPLLPEFASGSRDLSAFFYGNPLQCPAVVIRRRFYEQHGGWRPLVPADYELWIRAISRGGAVVSPEILACYRKSEGNQTSSHMRAGTNARDLFRCARLFEGVWPDRQVRELRERAADTALSQATFFRLHGDREAAAANLKAFSEIATARLIARRFARRVRDSLLEFKWKVQPW